jgi:hypothetical protein
MIFLNIARHNNQVDYRAFCTPRRVATQIRPNDLRVRHRGIPARARIGNSSQGAAGPRRVPSNVGLAGDALCDEKYICGLSQVE